MKMTKESYEAYIGDHSPKTNSLKNVTIAFLFGGLVCVIGDLLSRLYQMLGTAKPDASTYATITLVAIAAILTGLHVYDDIAKHVGAGIVVPITGFANSVCSPAGSTIQGVRTLEERGMRAAVLDAVTVAYEKNVELKKASD